MTQELSECTDDVWTTDSSEDRDASPVDGFIRFQSCESCPQWWFMTSVSSSTWICQWRHMSLRLHTSVCFALVSQLRSIHRLVSRW